MAMAQKLIELVRSIGNDVKLLTQRVDEAEGGAAGALTEAEAQTGTSAVQRTISAAVLKAAIVFHGLKIGTTATTAKAGNWLPAWGDVGDKPAFIAAGGTQAAARSAIGAGTSNLTLGSTSSTAKAGNWLPSVSDVTGLADALAGKVDKVTGKGLSSEDFTAAYKSKLDGVEAGAQVNPVIVNGLASDDASKVLSAAQGKALKGLIDNINTLLQSDDSTLDELQEIVDFVKLNRAELDSLGISSIAGLQQALDERVLSTDARLTNSREWTASTVTQAEAEAGTATTRRAWTAQRVWQAITAWWNASAAKAKLDGIATGATANQTDAFLLDRANHTGQQAIDTVVGLQSALDGKVDVQVVGFDQAHPDLTLTPDGRVATKNATAGMRNALRLKSKTGGRYYFEVTISTAASISSFGVALPSISLSASAYSSPLAWTITYNGFTNGSVVTSVSPGFAAGDTIGIAVDFDSGEMWASKNGIWLADGDPANGLNAGLTNIPVGVAPIVSLYPANLAATIRLTGGDLVNAPPAGFTPWSDDSINIDAIDGLRDALEQKVVKQAGYSLAADVKQGQWDVAYGWGNHASAGYALSSSLAAVATTGSYNDLSDKPTIPTLPATVSQAEAEAGSATAARLWTSQRVRQAITGWWTTVESTLPDEVLPPGTNGQVLKHNGTTWAAGADNNTTYTLISDAEAIAGTGIATRTVTPARLKLAIEAHAVPTATGQALEQRVSQLEASSSSGSITRARAQAIALCF